MKTRQGHVSLTERQAEAVVKYLTEAYRLANTPGKNTGVRIKNAIRQAAVPVLRAKRRTERAPKSKIA